MLKIYMGFVIIAVGAAAGMYYSQRLAGRVKQLNAVILMLDDISTLIRYKAATVQEIAEFLNEKDDTLAFIQTLNIVLKTEKNFDNAWEQAINTPSYFTASDKELLLRLGKSLGSSDIEGQISMLEMYKSLMKSEYDAAREQYSVKGKMYRSVGLLTGIGMAIIVM